MTNLIQKAKKGNAEAMNLLYEANKDTVYSLAYLLVRDESAAKKIILQVFRNAMIKRYVVIILKSHTKFFV